LEYRSGEQEFDTPAHSISLSIATEFMIAGLVIAIALLGYLIYTLIHPEKF